MGTYEDHTITTFALKHQAEEEHLGFKSSGSHPTFVINEETLVQKFQNVGLRSDDSDIVNDEEGGPDGSRLHPLRPYAEDCPYYRRTGTCKFGLNCRFNHPVRRINQVGKDKDKDNDKEGLSDEFDLIECKYYPTAGGCKYGNSCRFNHSKPESEVALPELNFLGLPIRLGEKECPFYMRNGSCGYGAHCRFHHPDPTTGGRTDPHNDESSGQFCHYSGYHESESLPMYLPGASSAMQIAQASWDSHILSNTTVPFLDNHSAYMPEMHSLPQGGYQKPEWSGYQAPHYPQERTTNPHSSPLGKRFMEKADNFMQFEEFPERPGQPESDYFMKTGDCKFRSAYRYHHPKSQAPKADVCVLGKTGLPLRPGKKICWHYESYGMCKYGRACLYDHPVNHRSSISSSD